MRVRVFGWYGQHNIGDEAFKLCFEQGFALLGAHPEIEYSADGFGAASHIILGGGDVIRPYYLERIAPGTAVYALGVGLGYESEIELLRGHTIPTALFRSRRDAAIARDAGIGAAYCPDLTFILPEAEQAQTPQRRQGRRLGVALSDEISPTWEERTHGEYLYFEYFKWELAAILDALAPSYQIEFIPLSVLDSIDDRKVQQDVFRRMRMRASVILHKEEMSVEKARSLIASFDLMISMKHHGIIFSLQSGVPFINIAATRKSQLFCRENGFDRLSIPEYSLQRERFLDVVRFAESSACRSQLQRAAVKLKAEASQAFPRALELYLEQTGGR